MISKESKYHIEYAKKNLKRIPLDVTKEKYSQIKTAADNAHESVNGYIKKAVDNRMDSEGVADRDSSGGEDQDSSSGGMDPDDSSGGIA